MRQLTRRERGALLIGAAALVTFAYTFGLLLPARRSLARAQSERAQLTDQIEQAERMYKEALAVQPQIGALRQRSRAVMFPSADVQTGMVREIEKLSKELSITVTSIRPGDAESADGSTKHPAVLKVDADLGKIVRLLYELEQPTRRLWVEGVEIAAARQGEGALTATIYVAAYSPARESEGGDAAA
ncbi:MAG: type 4a pilus biogenesis protein PilO [Armatimonadota bacterium]